VTKKKEFKKKYFEKKHGGGLACSLHPYLHSPLPVETHSMQTLELVLGDRKEKKI
jgi:hypothetical protein